MLFSLQPEVAQEVRDLLINPPAETPYTRLKTELVKRTSVSEQQRLHQLLITEELGDRKPTQLFRRMQQLLGENQLEPRIMKQLFLQRLPTNAQLILASTKDDLDTASLAKLADKILEIPPTHNTSPTLATVASPSTSQTQSTELHELRELVSQLTASINNFSLNFSPTHNGRNSRRRSWSEHRRSASPHHTNNNQERQNNEQSTSTSLCWYHTRFGDAAKKCLAPCSFHQQSPPSNYNARQYTRQSRLAFRTKAACFTLPTPQRSSNI